MISVITSALAVFALGGDMLVTSTAAGGVTVNYTANAFGALVGLVYFVGFWGWRGQSPGMIPFNMRIVMADDGSKPDWVRMLLRYVGLLISIAILLPGRDLGRVRPAQAGLARQDRGHGGRPAHLRAAHPGQPDGPGQPPGRPHY